MSKGGWPGVPHVSRDENMGRWLEPRKADVFFKASSLDVHTGQPAIDHIRTALELGAHAISVNKGPIVHALSELASLAREKGKRFLYEATVMDGVPIFSMFQLGLPATELRGFSGVLNSTTNVLLTEIEEGRSSEGGVRWAEAFGVAESDPKSGRDGRGGAAKGAGPAMVLY